MIQTLPAPRTRPTRVRRAPSNSLETCIRKRFCSSPYHHLQLVRCHCQGGVVLLTGVLPSFFMKQMAQESIRHIAGVMKIDNQVEVIYSEVHAKCVG